MGGVVMADMLLNGREPEPQEMAAVERGRRQELERDSRIVAGLVARNPEDEPDRRTVELLPPLGTL
jgi:hypothetical protein